jgi:hypothetical protein
MKYKYYVINNLQDNERKTFLHQCPCDLDLWRSDHKINKGHLIVMNNQ